MSDLFSLKTQTTVWNIFKNLQNHKIVCLSGQKTAKNVYFGHRTDPRKGVRKGSFFAIDLTAWRHWPRPFLASAFTGPTRKNRQEFRSRFTISGIRISNTLAANYRGQCHHRGRLQRFWKSAARSRAVSISVYSVFSMVKFVLSLPSQ